MLVFVREMRSLILKSEICGQNVQPCGVFLFASIFHLFIFSRQDYGNLYDFVTAKNLRIRNKSGKVKL